METIHSYRVNAISTIARSGVVAIEGIEPSISFSAPPEFRGIAGLWTPEHFFVTSVASCFVSTFSGISEISHFPFVSLELETEGFLDKIDGALRFSKIILRPLVIVGREEDRDRAIRILEKAEKGCLIARSINCPVELKSEVRVEEKTNEHEEIVTTASTVK